jgi:serine/threonine-protein kinase
MSPEQVAGERNLDARSDTYSLACVLYEMLAGQPPFTAATAQAVLARHVTDPVPAVTTVRPGLAAPIAAAIARAMSKAPADRFPAASAFAEALRADEVETEAQAKSIAVLPFGNMSADPENEYFCDGLTEAIINTFTAIKDFKVVARTSAFSFKGKDVDVRDIGRQLDVNNVLEGSVQKAGNRLRITAQLIDVSNGYHLWSERFDRAMDDVFAIQDEISLAIADNLQLELLEGDKDKLVKRHTDDPEAYNLYLKGRYFFRKFTQESFEKAIENFELAAAKDTSFALPFAGLADTYIEYGYFGMLPQREAIVKAKQMALKAVEMDASVGEAHTTLGVLYGLTEYNLESAGREHQAALALSPSNAEAHHHFAHSLSQNGRFDNAVREMKKALELEPLSVNLNCCLATTYYQARRPDEAIWKFKESIEIDPDYPLHYYYLGRTYLQKGMHQEAIATLEKGRSFPSMYVLASSALGYAHALAGNTDRAREILAELVTRSESEFVDAVLIGQIHIGLGEADAALDYLERGYEEQSFHLSGIGIESSFDNVREHPRFLELVSKMGIPNVPGPPSS